MSNRNINFGRSQRAIQVDQIPNYENEAVNRTEARLGAFIIENTQGQVSNSDLIDKGPCKLDNDAVYVGQWNKNRQREGRGVQIWKDGSKYEGLWKGDQTNGQGRLIHNDGDCYYGQWLNDRAHGFGTFERTFGPKYVGFWSNDK